jgi:putative copper resistance protein D
LSTFFELFGFLSVLANGLDLLAQSVLLGTIAFLLLLGFPLQRNAFDFMSVATFNMLARGAVAALVTASCVSLLGAVALTSSLHVPWQDVVGADFMLAGAAKIAAACGLWGIALKRPAPTARARIVLVALAAVILGALLATSHAAARPGSRTVMLTATALHAAGAALWLGGLPCFWLAIGPAGDRARRAQIARRYSSIAIAGVSLIAVGAAAMSVDYIGSAQGLYGTPYGAMALGKLCLLAVLLLLGLGNFLAVRVLDRNTHTALRIRRFVEVEMGIGAAAVMLAASITSVPPAIDTPERITLRDLAQRIAPRWPRLESPDHASLAIPALQARLDAETWVVASSGPQQAFVPGAGQTPPRDAHDIAWSEYNHHWSGLIVLAIGFVSLLHRTGRVPGARHWPLLFLALAAFLFYRADAEVWPAGSIGFFESMKDPEVVQHRIFVLLTIAFALFEWGVRTGRIASRRLALVFPLLTALGGTLLLTHSHAIANLQEELLIEYSHLPMGILGLCAGWARWLELRGDPGQRRWAGWVWPVCFVLIGLLLIDYREA